MIFSKNLLLGTSAILMIFCIIPFTSCGLFYDFDRNENNIENSIIESNNADPIGESYDNSGYKVIEVIDGDTIILSNNERIRFIGMNTPEEGMYFFEEARDVLEIMILGKEVRLEVDISDLDQYGRKLRYVYHRDIFVNLEMVKRGFANTFTYPPDVKYSEQFLEAERYARENNLGLWESSKINTVGIEINFDAPGNDNENINGEFVILENIGPEILDTSGWTIKDSGTSIYHFGSYKFNPDARIVLFSGEGKDRNEDDEKRYLFWNSQRPVWNNDNDTLYLRDKEGLLMEIYNY